MNDLLILWNLLNWPYIASFVLLSYAISSRLAEESKINKAWIVFILASVLAPVFYFLSDVISKTSIIGLIVSYAVGTSLYELILKFIIKKFKEYFKIQ